MSPGIIQHYNRNIILHMHICLWYYGCHETKFECLCTSIYMNLTHSILTAQIFDKRHPFVIIVSEDGMPMIDTARLNEIKIRLKGIFEC